MTQPEYFSPPPDGGPPFVDVAAGAAYIDDAAAGYDAIFQGFGNVLRVGWNILTDSLIGHFTATVAAWWSGAATELDYYGGDQ